MPSYLQTLPRCSFDGIEFPYLESSLKGGFRYTRHEARYRPGGELEKHKRRLYTVSLAAIFDARVPGYSGLYPENLGTLMQLFEAGKTAPLTLPNVGTFPAMADDWTRTVKPAVQMSGEQVSIIFVEDSVNEALLSGIRTRIATKSVAAAASEVASAAEDVYVLPLELQAITNAVNAALEAKAMVEQASLLAEGKIQGALQLLREVDNTILALQPPENWALVNAIQELGGALKELSDTALGGEVEIRTFVVPVTMTLQELSMATYKVASHGSDLLALNSFDDSSAIPAGMRVRWAYSR